MRNSMIMFTFFVLEWKYPFWANLVQKIKIASLSWNLAPTLIRICRIQWWCLFFLCFIGNTLFGQVWPKKSKLLVEVKIWYLHNSNMQNSIMLFSFFVFEWKYPFWANLVQKVKIISWIWNLVARLIRICRIQWCCSLFCFSVEIPFLG